MAHVKYFWDEIEDNVIEEYDGGTGNTIVTYTTEPTLYGSVLTQDRGGQVRHFHYDGTGSALSLTDNGGNVTDTRKYAAFGEVTESSGTTEFPYQWGGKWGYRLEYQSGLAVRQRMYSPEIARWRSLDPMYRIDCYLNLYAFVQNNPVDDSDPSGLITYADATCSVTSRYRHHGQKWCTFTCECPAGFSAGFLSLTYDRACSHPPSIKCFRLDAWDLVFVVVAVGVSCLDSPAPGPADAGGAAILGARGLQGLVKYAW